MKTFSPKYLYFLLFPLLLSSCAISYGDYSTSNFEEMNRVNCESMPESIYVFWENEGLDFEYRIIGKIEAIGGESASDDEVMDHLKYQAWQNCANGIIYLSESIEERETGLYIDPESVEYYNARSYSGVAVQIERDYMFTEKYGQGMDTTFVSDLRKEFEKAPKKEKAQGAGTVVGAVFGIIGLTIEGILLLMD